MLEEVSVHHCLDTCRRRCGSTNMDAPCNFPLHLYRSDRISSFLYTIRVIRVPHSLRPAASYGNSKLHVIAPGSCITDTAGSSIIARSVQHQGTSAVSPGGTNSARPGEATAAGSFSRHQNNGSEISAAPANNQGCVAIGGSNGGAGGIGER